MSLLLKLTNDPMSIFAGLLRGCISDRKERDSRKEAAEGAALLLSGLVSSMVTAYFLSVLGVFV